MSGDFSFDSQSVAQAIDRNDVKGAASLLSQIYQTDSRQFSAIVGTEQIREQQNPGLTHLAIQDRGNGSSNVYVTDNQQAQIAGIIANRPAANVADNAVIGAAAGAPATLVAENFLAAQAAARPTVVAPDYSIAAQPPMRPAVLPSDALVQAPPLPVTQTNFIPGGYAQGAFAQPAVYSPQQHFNFEAQRLAQAVNYNNFGATAGLLQNEFRTNPGEAIRLVQNEVNREAMQPGLRMPGHTHVEMRGGAALVADGMHQPVMVGRIPTNAYGYGNQYMGAYPYRPMPLVRPVAMALGVPLGGYHHHRV